MYNPIIPVLFNILMALATYILLIKDNPDGRMKLVEALVLMYPLLNDHPREQREMYLNTIIETTYNGLSSQDMSIENTFSVYEWLHTASYVLNAIYSYDELPANNRSLKLLHYAGQVAIKKNGSYTSSRLLEMLQKVDPIYYDSLQLRYQQEGANLEIKAS